MTKEHLLDITDIADGIRHQAEHCARNDALRTGKIVTAQIALMQSETECGRRIKNWPGLPLEDAMPLRLAAGFHNLHLTQSDDRLTPIYDGEISNQDEIDAIIQLVTRDHDARLLPWFDSPPQTNEAGRSASFMAALKWLSGHIGSQFEMNELGASAGINSMMDRYHYDLGGVTAGPSSSPMQIKPEWRGAPPPNNDVIISQIQGCDQAPIILSQPENAMRVKSYVWPENIDRMTRMDAAILLATQQQAYITKMDAADWVLKKLNAPQEQNTTRVFYHSIVWQYIPADRREIIKSALFKAGESASIDKPLAWISLETNRETFRHELRVHYWNGSDEDGKPHLLAQAQAHGAWVEWFN